MRIFFLSALLLLAGCNSGRDSQQSRVDASQYDSFWLWAGVKPQPVLERAKQIYLLVGEIEMDGQPVKVRRAIPDAGETDIWMVLRVETLDWSPDHYKTLLDLAEKWEAGNNLVGIQIDFDANTRKLDGYADFLRDLRERLPRKYALGITGLLDWSANGDPVELAAIADVVDEAVFQVYQGRHTINGYEKWLTRLDNLPMPFRIGLVQGGEWREPAALPANPNFRGYVVFLLNPDGQEEETHGPD